MSEEDPTCRSPQRRWRRHPGDGIMLFHQKHPHHSHRGRSKQQKSSSTTSQYKHREVARNHVLGRPGWWTGVPSARKHKSPLFFPATWSFMKVFSSQNSALLLPSNSPWSRTMEKQWNDLVCLVRHWGPRTLAITTDINCVICLKHSSQLTPKFGCTLRSNPLTKPSTDAPV